MAGRRVLATRRPVAGPSPVEGSDEFGGADCVHGPVVQPDVVAEVAEPHVGAPDVALNEQAAVGAEGCLDHDLRPGVHRRVCHGLRHPSTCWLPDERTSIPQLRDLAQLRMKPLPSVTATRWARERAPALVIALRTCVRTVSCAI